ncbi:6797_t:CDS:2 [Acaulospora morrowiae]|uniref:Peptide hydrolase n=1 Tax=Acaulospora morrowiae TaxID=94023 RepID=A0A9N8W767_9GLOM|nr:6797_t:CDS:2 [Acaulospora morrowiae]
MPRAVHDAPEEITLPHDLTDNIFAHLKALNDIAYRSTRNSRSVTDGFNASAEYVISQLNKTGCEVKLQYFKVPIWEKEKEAELNVTFDNGVTVAYQGGIDFWSMRYGGQATNLIFQGVTEVKKPCDEGEEWDVEGKVALIRLREKCDLWEIALKAEKSGASAVIFYNTPEQKKLSYSRVRIVDWKEGDPLIAIPVLAASNSMGQLLSNSQHINITTYTKLFVVETFNVLCYLNDHGDKQSTIVVGSHLDSVPAGPGLVDNASGSSTILEILLYLEKKQFKSRNRLIFAWWGAEELGLLGSRHFVRQLMNSGENVDVAMNLNFDMLGSPNYIPFVLRGSDAPSDARNGSIRIQRVLELGFDEIKKNYNVSDMLGGSDFLPFVQNGIPSGGLYTGSSEIKSRRSQREFGGIANAPLDPCYHKECDSLENVSKEAISVQNSCFNNYSVPDAITLESIISSAISFEERRRIESAIFLPLHDLIIPTHKPNRKKAPRSQNSFVIFRKNFQARMTYEKGPGYSSQLKTVSKHAKDIWRMLASEEKSIYERIASIATMVHKVIWPNYSYRPNRKETKRNEHSNHSHICSSASFSQNPSSNNSLRHCLNHDDLGPCDSFSYKRQNSTHHPSRYQDFPHFEIGRYPNYNKYSPYYIPRLEIQPCPILTPIQPIQPIRQLEMETTPSITPYDKSILNTVDKYFKI